MTHFLTTLGKNTGTVILILGYLLMAVFGALYIEITGWRMKKDLTPKGY